MTFKLIVGSISAICRQYLGNGIVKEVGGQQGPSGSIAQLEMTRGVTSREAQFVPKNSDLMAGQDMGTPPEQNTMRRAPFMREQY